MHRTSVSRSLAAVLVLAVVALPCAALEIRPRFTAGPFPGLSRELTGPDLSAEESPCTALDLESPAVDEKTAFCLAAREWQRHLADEVTLEIEAYALEAPFFNFLGAASSPLWWLLAPQGNPQEPNLGWSATLQLLKVDDAQEPTGDEAVHHLPNLNQLELRLPDTLPEDFEPLSVALTASQLKALGVAPRPGFLQGGSEMEFATLAHVDGVVVINTGRRPFDLDPRDGVGIGPLPVALWDAFDLSDPETVPAGFFPEVFDFVGLAAHEIGHVLGFESGVDALNDGPPPPDARVVHALDLFRIVETEVAGIENPGDFRAAARNLRAEGAGQAAPELGNHAFVHRATAQQGAAAVPLASGLAGDGTQAAHLRSSLVRFRDANADLESLEWIEDRQRPCPPDAGWPAGAACPYGTLMKPLSVPHTPAVITFADLVVLDLVGWDVDYDGALDPAGDGSDGSPSTLDELETALGLEAVSVVATIQD